MQGNLRAGKSFGRRCEAGTRIAVLHWFINEAAPSGALAGNEGVFEMTDTKRSKGGEAARLSLVSDLAPLYDLGRKPDTTAQRVQRLQAEARMLAREQINALMTQMETAAATAAEIAQGGDAYPVGVREQAERLTSDLESRVQGLRLIMDRIPEPKL